jgi:hypothetical protein
MMKGLATIAARITTKYMIAAGMPIIMLSIMYAIKR